MMKKMFKIMFLFFVNLLLLPIFIVYKIQQCFTKSDRFFADCAQLVSMFPGTMGDYIRKAYYKFTLQKCSDTCHIGFRTIFAHPEAEIGENVYIGVNCMIGTVTIEDDVLIGSNVDILDGKKQHGIDRLDIPIRMQAREIQRVIIGNGSWLGNSSVVMSDVGAGAVIGAGSVVVNPISKSAIAVGNPARIVKMRGE